MNGVNARLPMHGGHKAVDRTTEQDAEPGGSLVAKVGFLLSVPWWEFIQEKSYEDRTQRPMPLR